MASNTKANGTSTLFHLLDLNDYGLEEVPPTKRREVKEEVRIILEEEIFNDIADGKSPVKGEGRFQRLDKDYAKDEKGGVRTANLELEGDLLSDLQIKNAQGSKLFIGHKGKEVPKSDGHNQMSDKAKSWARKSKMPKRRYIPADDQLFVKSITDNIRRIIKSATPTEEERQQRRREELEDEGGELVDIDDSIATRTPATSGITAPTTGVTVESLFSESSLEAFVAQAIQRRQNGR